VWAPWAGVCGVPGGCLGKSLKGLAVTRTRHRGHVAGSSRTARPWHGHGEAGGVAGSEGRHGPCRVVRTGVRSTPWPPRVAARRWHGGTAVVSGQGKGSVDGSGVLARARVLEHQDRSVAMPCARHRHSGPAARRGGEGRRRLQGVEAALTEGSLARGV
jgi:hypothetical protein